MIRMGRSSRTSTEASSSETSSYQGSSTQVSNGAYPRSEDVPTAQPRVVAESESIARDIKEGRLSGFVGHGTTLTGETSFQMMLRVDGHLTGSVTSDGGTLIVGSTGQVDANIAVAIANVNGSVNGDIIATERIQLGRTARVMGNILTPKLVVEDGAIFEGSCSMMRAIESREQQAAAQAEHYRQQEMARYQPSETTAATTESSGLFGDEEEEAAEATA
ncbi:MAG: polymer-forming cytoskeletal protein [Pyrinomonadaceae bacterium]